MAITSFADSDTRKIYEGKHVRRFHPDVAKRARMKMRIIDAATCDKDLRSPPSNHFEKLKADREGQYSIRVNNQYRICFTWDGSNAGQVELCDYH